MESIAFLVAAHISQDDVVSFALTCTTCLAGVRETGRPLKTRVASAVTSVARLKWAVEEMDVPKARICHYASRAGAWAVFDIAKKKYGCVHITTAMLQCRPPPKKKRLL